MIEDEDEGIEDADFERVLSDHRLLGFPGHERAVARMCEEFSRDYESAERRAISRLSTAILSGAFLGLSFGLRRDWIFTEERRL